MEHVVLLACTQLNRTCSIMHMYMYTANIEHLVFRTCTQLNRTCTCTNVHSCNVNRACSIMYDRYMYI